MKIVSITPEYLTQSAQLFQEEYSEGNDVVWNIETAVKYLQRDVDQAPEYCLAAVDNDNRFLGSIFCSTRPYYTGTALFIDSIQVTPDSRHKGVAKELLKKVITIAHENSVTGVHLLADGRDDFPKEWYMKLGFTFTGWVEYEGNIEKLLQQL